MSIDGFYLAYMSSEGYGVVLLVFKQGQIVGADAGGVSFDGTYEFIEHDQKYNAVVTVSAPQGIELIQGVNTGSEGLKYDVQFSLPSNFLEFPYIELSTPIGPVNLKLQKIRDLGGIQ